jgi:ABC-type sugar transport system substrate-binding protein
LRQEYPQLPIFSVLCDQHEIGRIQGWQYRALLPRGGELLYIRGPLGTSSATMRFEGLQEVLKDSSIQVFTLNSDWTFEGGAREMKQWTRIFDKGELPRCVVGAQNDAMAMGARSVLEQVAQSHRSFITASIPFCGCDGSPAYGQRLVTDGKLAATVIMPVGASRAVAEIDSMLSGGPRPPAAIVLKPLAFPEPHFLRPGGM